MYRTGSEKICQIVLFWNDTPIIMDINGKTDFVMSRNRSVSK